MNKRNLFTPFFLGGLVLGGMPLFAGTPEQGVRPTNPSQQTEQGTQQQGLGQQEQAPAQKPGVVQPEQGTQPPAQKPGVGQPEQGTQPQQGATQKPGVGQPEQGTQPQPGQQGQQGQQQAALPKDMPKMIVIKAQPDKTGAEQKAEIFTVDKTVKVNDDKAAQEVNKELEQQQGTPLTECDQTTVPTDIQTLFSNVDRGDSQPLSWAPRWHFWNNRGIYGYGYRPYYGYRYPRYYGNYGYYYGGVTYPYTYSNYYYPYGGYNYYYYYNPYYY